MRFYLGTHKPNWLGQLSIPLFVSRRRLAGRKTFPRAAAPWALDSGGFTEVTQFGGWVTTPEQYAREVRTFRDEIGLLDFAAPQDHMCEPLALKATGLTVRDHQRLTVENLARLYDLDDTLPWMPVLQGWELGDYLHHIELYQRAGFDLRYFERVGIGSVCRRQATDEIAAIIETVAGYGISLHGFGVKKGGLAKIGHRLGSSDSMAWSFTARRRPPLPGCVGHINCANCLRFALMWRKDVLRTLGQEVA